MSFIVAVDGPAGAGKSTIARLVAERMGMALVDTGAIYRSVAFRAIRGHIPLNDGEALGALASRLHIEFVREAEGDRVLCDGEDITLFIRTQEVSRATSAIAALPPVRQALLEHQRRLGRHAPIGAVLEGRDIGTVVFPNAEVKIFLTASPEERAKRRFDELAARGVKTSFEAVLAEQIHRDRADETRATAPLVAAPDSVPVDTTGLTMEAVVARILHIVRHRMTGRA